MLVKKLNKVYSINETEKNKYLKNGFDVIDENGAVIESAETKTITYAEHLKVVEDLEAQIEELKAKVGVKNVQNTVENTGKAHVEPTIAELKEKATALGLEFKGNISKADLKALIEDAEKAPEGEGNPELDPEGDE